MSELNIFLDSSALIAGVISKNGAAYILLELGEQAEIILTISEMVVTESERAIAKKSPKNLKNLQETIKAVNMKVVEDPSPEEKAANLYLIDDPDDVPILLAAMKAKVDYLATHNRKHFLDNPNVAKNSGLRIGTPGDVLAWLRERL
ncbi:MAG: PIN domain-containing protein [Chloroflexota bacterium]